MRYVSILLGALAMLAGAIVLAARLDRIRACDSLVDGEHGCVVQTRLVDAIAERPDGTVVPATIREQKLVWLIDRPGAYKLDLHPTGDAPAAGVPSIHVEDSLGRTVSDGSGGWRVKTRSLEPGAYRIHVSGATDVPHELVLAIEPLPPIAASR